MVISEAKARANAKWRRENMGSITLHFRKALIKQIQEAADREGITRDRWLKNTIKGEIMTKTMTIEEAITQLTTTKPHQLNIPEAMALAATMLLKGPTYLTELMQTVPDGFLLSDTTANSALKSLEEDKITEGYWEKAGGKGRPRRMYRLADGAEVGPIAALNVCGGSIDD